MLFNILIFCLTNYEYYGHDQLSFEWNTSDINAANLWVSLVENETSQFYTLPERGSPLLHLNIENDGQFSWTIPDIHFPEQIYRICFSENEFPNCLEMDFYSRSNHQYFVISSNIITNFSLNIPNSFYINQYYNITISTEPRDRLYIYGGVLDQYNNYIYVFPPTLTNPDVMFSWYSGYNTLQDLKFKFIGYTWVLGIPGDFVMNCFDMNDNSICDSNESMFYYSDSFSINSSPSQSPTINPTYYPTISSPTIMPSNHPTYLPTTNIPTFSPSNRLTLNPTRTPSMINRQVVNEGDTPDNFYISPIAIVIYSLIFISVIILLFMIIKCCQEEKQQNRVGVQKRNMTNRFYDNAPNPPTIGIHRIHRNGIYENRRESHL